MSLYSLVGRYTASCNSGLCDLSILDDINNMLKNASICEIHDLYIWLKKNNKLSEPLKLRIFDVMLSYADTLTFQANICYSDSGKDVNAFLQIGFDEYYHVMKSETEFLSLDDGKFSMSCSVLSFPYDSRNVITRFMLRPNIQFGIANAYKNRPMIVSLRNSDNHKEEYPLVGYESIQPEYYLTPVRYEDPEATCLINVIIDIPEA